MLRKGLALLVMSAVCASTAVAADGKAGRTQASQSGGLLGWLKDKAGADARPARRSPASPIQRAVVADAERQSANVRQTGERPDLHDEPAEAGDQFVEIAPPVPIMQPPAVPNTSTTSGPQSFSSNAAGFSNPVPVTPAYNWQQYTPPQPVQATTAAPVRTVSSAVPAHLMVPATMVQENGGEPTANMATINAPGMYPQTGAALYPAPVPGIPYQIGGTITEHPALQPHEMLYPHRYKAMYPPYYYKVNGGWWVSPFGVWSHENWKLQGTTVDVKYRSHISPFALFKAPGIR